METQKPKNLPRRWTASEDAELSRNFPEYRVVEVAQNMGRSTGSAYNRAKKLNLSKVCNNSFIPAVVKLQIRSVEVSNQIAQPKGIDLVRRESYVAPPWASFRASADDHFKYKSKWF